MLSYRQAAYADSTKNTYNAQRRAFLRFCLYFSLSPVPVTSNTLCKYAAFLARSLSPSSIPGYLNIIRIMHFEAGFDNPLEDWALKLVLRGIKRLHGKPPNRKLPITFDILIMMYNQLDMSLPFNKAFWAASTVAFFTFLRKASLLPKSHNKTNSALCRSDVSFCEQGAILSVCHTKTIQCRERVLRIPIPRINNSVLCPIAALQDLLDNTGTLPRDAPLFSFKVKDKLCYLSYASFTKALKCVLQTCGFDSKFYSGHSFRRGGASLAFSCKVPPLLIKSQGDWKSEAYQAYIDIPLSTKWDMLKLMTDSVK